ncbi:ArsA family ATPase [Streptomyces profundus]|uniref:ArsA family ATPase n=1 Tax=Streptomyces profundus TaxID=2867410 RepID=UPI001D162094|nr:ArsA-related P-loop ATPase [Streptomyces sp. MA3_2.13]UED83719.1 ArsA family ATPase [Streptomyces sp. MA3_2.13]
MTDTPHGASRTLLVTGPGGDGVSSVAAATALAGARAGRLTLLLSREPADRLAALLGGAPVRPDGRPTEAAPGLWVARIDPAADFRAAVLAAQRTARSTLATLGSATLQDDELTELPGAEPLAVLAALRAAHAAERWPLIVVDLPPALDAVRLLALPEQLRRYLRQLLPGERRTARALRPLLAQIASIPMPADGLFTAAEGWDEALAEGQRLIEAPGTAARLVFEPNARSAATARTARAGLALHGVGVEEIIANRLVPQGSDPWLAGVAARQAAVLAEFAGAALLAEPPRRLPMLVAEPDAAALAELLPPPPTADVARQTPVLEDRLADEGLLVWRLPLPGAAKESLDLVRQGDELVVTVGPFRRVLALPSAPRRCTIAGAAFASGELTVRFAPDPARWPERSPG